MADHVTSKIRRGIQEFSLAREEQVIRGMGRLSRHKGSSMSNKQKLSLGKRAAKETMGLIIRKNKLKSK